MSGFLYKILNKILHVFLSQILFLLYDIMDIWEQHIDLSLLYLYSWPYYLNVLWIMKENDAF